MLPESSSTLLPISYPTTTIHVDDHEHFLEMLPAMLDPLTHIQAYVSAHDALRAIDDHRTRNSTSGEWLYRWRNAPAAHEELIAVDIDSIHRVAYDPDRFATVSVIIADYAMPEMNGLDFFRRLVNPHLGKILLTGRADEAVAVEAFNQGVIDWFIRKSDPFAFEKLTVAIESLKRRYFESLSAFVSETLAISEVTFFRDPVVADAVTTMCGAFRPVEIYVMRNPPGVFLIDDWGFGRRLVVMTDAEMAAQVEIAEDEGAPRELVEALKSGRFVANFHSTNGQYHAGLEDPMRFLHPATCITGERIYHATLVENVDYMKMNRIKPFRTWLLEHDE